MREMLFTGFGLFTILCAVGVVFSRQAVYSAFCLILSFFGLSAIYLLWGATFIAMIQVLIYTGAIVVLFVFVVMLLDLGKATGPSWGNSFVVLLAGSGAWLFSLMLLRTLNQASSLVAGQPPISHESAMRSISRLLFTDYLWPFEVLSVFLLALIIAIYALARPEEHETREV
jgi:NADH-quinone oxidoreductase subunit J